MLECLKMGVKKKRTIEILKQRKIDLERNEKMRNRNEKKIDKQGDM